MAIFNSYVDINVPTKTSSAWPMSAVLTSQILQVLKMSVKMKPPHDLHPCWCLDHLGPMGGWFHVNSRGAGNDMVG